MADPTRCQNNMGWIHLQAGDLVGAYRYFLPAAERGDEPAIRNLIEICYRAGALERAAEWAAKLSEAIPTGPRHPPVDSPSSTPGARPG